MLIFKMSKDRLYFGFSFNIDVNVGLRSYLRMLSLKIFADQDQRHQEYLDHIRDEKPQNKCWIGIELECLRHKNISAEPKRGP